MIDAMLLFKFFLFRTFHQFFFRLRFSHQFFFVRRVHLSRQTFFVFLCFFGQILCSGGVWTVDVFFNARQSS